MIGEKMKKIILLTICSILLLFTTFSTVKALSRTCKIGGRYYRHGQTTVDLMDNGLLYRCTCFVSQNGRSRRYCNESREDAQMLIADTSRIQKVLLGAPKGFLKDYIHGLRGIAVAVDVDYKRNYVFWTDVSSKGKGIYRASLSDIGRITKIISKGKTCGHFKLSQVGFKFELDDERTRLNFAIVLTGEGYLSYAGVTQTQVHEEIYEPNGLAVDWLSNHIYWTDAQLGSIFVANYNGENRARLIGGLSEPRSIALLPREGLMFWSDQTKGTIERAAMDGSRHRIIVADLVWPNEVALDRHMRRIYWLDGSRKTIESCDFNGNSYTTIYDFTLTFDSPGFGLAYYKQRLYFGVWNKHAIYSVTSLGQHLHPTVKRMGSKPMGIAIVNTLLQTHSRITNICWKKQRHCSHLCLPVSSEEYRCSCPSGTGLVLGDDGRNCVIPDKFLLYTSLEDGTVMQVSMNSGASKIPTMFAQSHRPSAVDFDPIDKMVYWSDVAMNAIYRKPMNESPTEVYLQDGIGTVDGLCVDWVNRYLYFTNVGMHRGNVPFHRLEMIDLRNKNKRKIITWSVLSKPRDVVIDNVSGFLYVSDWGAEPKIIRLDLDGRNPRTLPVKVENPNGLAYHNKYLYITDSHRRNAIVQANGTIVYRDTPKLIRYDTIMEQKLKLETSPVEMELPFGISMSNDNLYFTDWELGGIYTMPVGGNVATDLIVGVKRPTGVKYATLRASNSTTNACKTKPRCNDICVSADETDFTCLCSDQSGRTKSDNNNGNCVSPDSFVLVADGNRIVMKSLVPPDRDATHYYPVIETYDPLAEIVAVTFDPVNRYVYWVDNGRQQLNSRQLDVTGKAVIRTIYNNLGQVDGLELDPINRLLYWTDVKKGTIEVLHLSSNLHSTVLRGLDKPRALVLNSQDGMMYWTEWGKNPMIMGAKMNGQDFRPLLQSNLKWPNGLLYDEKSKKLFFADGGTLSIQSISSGRNPKLLDFIDVNGFAGHLYGLDKDVRSDALILTDWKNRTVLRLTKYETFEDKREILMKDMNRPSQVHVQNVYTHSGHVGPCQPLLHQCSHLCIPDKTNYACLCPDKLVLANDLRTCVTGERAAIFTSPAPTTTTLPTTISSSTAPWAVKLTTRPAQVETTEQIFETNATVTDLITITNSTIAVETTPQSAAISFTTAASVSSTAAVLGEPRFTNCDQQATYQVPLPKDKAFVAVTPTLLKLQAVDGDENPINVTVVDNYEKTIPFLPVRAGWEVVHFRAFDRNGHQASCAISLNVTDETPPRSVECPQDIFVETYSGKSVFVKWKFPKFEDNSKMQLNITNNYEPGFFDSGIYPVKYLATDRFGNSVSCEFEVAVSKNPTRCGMPHVPENSKLSCTTDQKSRVQKCLLMCDDGYRLTLSDPYIKCKINRQSGVYQWLPFMDEHVCKKPEVGNVEQAVLLNYPCPCKPELEFYEKRQRSIGTALKQHPRCKNAPRLGFCNNWKSKIFMECVNQQNLNVTVTVDLAEPKRVATTKEAKRIVERGAVGVIDMVYAGKVTATGTDMKQYKAQFDNISVLKTKVVCSKGYIVDKDGCVSCPKGTYWEAGICKFCPVDTYQDAHGQVSCHRCAPNKETATYGAMNVHYCHFKKEATTSGSSNSIVIGGTVGGAILLIASLLLIGFIHWRRKNNKLKKEQERKKRQKQARERRKRKEAAASTSSAPDIEERQQNAKPNQEATTAPTSRTTSTEQQQQPLSGNVPKPKIRMTLQEIPPYSAIKKKQTQEHAAVKDSTAETTTHGAVGVQPQLQQMHADVHIARRSNDDDTMSEANTNVSSRTDDQSRRTSDDGRKSTGTGSETVNDGAASDTLSIASINKPLKSALKKRSRPPPSNEYLEDDTSTIISASTISLGRLRKMQGRRPTSLDDDIGRADRQMHQGRQRRRSASMRRPESVSPTKFMPRVPDHFSAEPLPMKRSTSMDLRANMYHPRHAPRLNVPVLRRPASPILGRMPRPADNYLLHGTPKPPHGRQRPPLYATFRPRGMPVPGHRQFHPATGARDPYMTLPAGVHPMPGRPPQAGYWNDAFDGGGEWKMPMRGDMKVPPPPPQTMTLPRSMAPRYRLQAGMMPGGHHPPMPPRFFPRMHPPPPPYYA